MGEERREDRPEVGTAATATETGQPAATNVSEQTPAESTSRAVAGSAGATGGALGGAAAGTVVLGPIGAMIGAIAGAIGGGWTGMAAGAPTHYTVEHDREYREHYESDRDRLADRPYDSARAAYQLGHFAARNPDYANRDFESIESDLQRGWTDDARSGFADWHVARRSAREANARERARRQGHTISALALGGTESHQRPEFSYPIATGDPDRVSGDRDLPGRESGDT